MNPSTPELRERLRQKTRRNFVILHPAVKGQIEHLKEAKKWQSREHPDEDFPTVIHSDLIHAIRTGVIVHAQEMVDMPCWAIAVNGVSRDGIKLTVSVYLMKNDEEPLLIMSFAPLPDETEIDE